MTVRSGSAEWHGSVEGGSGTATIGDSVFEDAYSYDSRFGEGQGTDAEQLIAAAHPSCFMMALSNILSAVGTRRNRCARTRVSSCATWTAFPHRRPHQ